MNRQLLRQYGLIASLLGAFLVLLLFVLAQPLGVSAAEQRQLVQPMIALVGLTGVVWVLMFVYRNVAVARGAAPVDYYQTYGGDAPPEWVERPARTFMNLLEVPVLFYVVCILMLQTEKWDSTQASLAWLFVGTRFVHAFVYIGINYVPLRLVTYAMGCITLAVIWWRFAAGFV